MMPLRPGSAIQDERSSAEQDLLIYKPAIRKELLRMVVTLEGNIHAREDLLQEALLYLWTRERQHPMQRVSWYLRGVKFHLKDLKDSGRSLDSPKRREAQASFPDHCDEWDNWRDSLEFEEGFLSAVAARDIFSVLVDRLRPSDQRILCELAGGQGVGDIAGKLETSHQSVKRSRDWIAALAVKLGVVPPAS